MAVRAFIPVTNHNDGSNCTNYYDIRFKLASLPEGWTTLTQQQVEEEGSPLQYGLVLNNLEDETVYDYEITRHCCEGTNSVITAGSFDTTDV